MHPVHEAHPERGFDPARVGVDGDIQEPRPDPDEQEQDDEGLHRAGERRQHRRQPEHDEPDGHEPRPEGVRQPAGGEHRGQGSERNRQQREPELRVARARRILNRRQARRPTAPEQAKDGEGRREAFRVAQSCR